MNPEQIGLWASVLSLIASALFIIFEPVKTIKNLDIFPITWDRSARYAYDIVKRVGTDGWMPDIIVCLGRSGGIWGGFLAGNLGSKPAFMIMDYYHSNDSYVRIEYMEELSTVIARGKHTSALVIQGYTASGATMFTLKQMLQGHPTLQNIEVRYATVFCWSGCLFRFDYIGKLLAKPPRKMPWHVSDLYVTGMDGQKRMMVTRSYRS